MVISDFLLVLHTSVGWQDVEPNSPAAQAGLRSQTDYIIGTDSLTIEVRDF